MPHLVTSSQGLDHIESYNARHYNAGTQGNGSFAFRGRGDFALSMPNTNTLRIASGDAQCCGAHWSIDGDYEEYTIETGTPGYKRIDLVVADIVTAPKEEIKIMVLKGEEVAGNDGEPVAPIPIQGNLNAGDTHVQMPICSVTLNGINPGDPVMLMDFLMPASEFQAAEKERWDSIFRIASGSHKGTCVADSIIGFDVLLDVPDGYRIASIVGLRNASAGALVPSDVKVSGAVVSVLLRNTTMMTQPFTLDVQAVCTKAELFA